MKVLYSCLSKSWGGMEMVTITGIKQMQKNNIEVELLCIAESRLHLEANNLGIIIHTVKLNSFLNPFLILKLFSILKKNRYDIIHSHASKDLWLLVPAIKLYGKKVKLVFTKHVASGLIKKDFLHRWIYKSVDLAIAISNMIKQNLIDTTSLISGRIKVLFNGVDTKMFNPEIIDRKKFRNELKIDEKKTLIGMIGRFSPGKGHEEFLLAARMLNEKYNNLEFVIVGEASRGEDKYENEIKNLAKDFKLDNLHFTGFRADVKEVLAGMDIFVFPSHAESFGIALIEAMSMGKAAVASNSDGVLDIITDSKTGLLFKVKDASDLMVKISKLIEDENLRSVLGNNARKKVIDTFDLDKVTGLIINEYNQLIKQNRL